QLGDAAVALLELAVELPLVFRPVLLPRLEALLELQELELSALQLGSLVVDLGSAVAQLVVPALGLRGLLCGCCSLRLDLGAMRIESLLVHEELGPPRLVVGLKLLKLDAALLLDGRKLVDLCAAPRDLVNLRLVDVGVELVVRGLRCPRGLGARCSLCGLGALGLRGGLALQLGAQTAAEALYEILVGALAVGGWFGGLRAHARLVSNRSGEGSARRRGVTYPSTEGERTPSEAVSATA